MNDWVLTLIILIFDLTNLNEGTKDRLIHVYSWCLFKYPNFLIPFFTKPRIIII